LGNAQRRNGSKQADDYRKKAMHEQSGIMISKQACAGASWHFPGPSGAV
jgi:hypothetical protein